MMPYVLGLPETFNTKVDNTTTLSAGDKRKSIRIASTSAVTIGSLIICDIIPWPAWWTVGTDWPSNGEIDILEGVNLETTNQYTLHVKDSDCKQSSSVDITGNAVEANNDCNANNDGNAGCSYAEPASGSYGEDFNKKGGGVFVTEFTADAISIWFWSRADIPENIVSGSPDSSTWGKPSATWPKDSCDIASYFDASSGDPTHGQVDYVSLDDAKSAGLISTSGTSAMMPYVLGLPETFNTKVDNTTTLSAGDKRKSIRIASTSAVTIGSLIICDIIPWPAWWTVGTDWPSNGEIDILEGVNLETTNQYTLHVKDSDCKQSSSVDITGNAVEANNDCNANNDGNAGCSYAEPASGSYGEDFNKKGGGVFVTEFTADAISIWFWSRADIPENIVSGSPDSSTWGKPSATWPKDSCDIASYFDASSGDPTHGQVDYVSLDDAKSAGLISTSGTSAMMPYVLGLPETFNTKVDNTTTLSAGDKRKSIRIASTSAVTIGSLIICDIIPWPAWWTVGTDWPSNGEIDILEGVNLETTNQYTLHVKDSDCKQSSSVDITGNAVEANNDCNANNDGNAGCSYAEPASGNYGEDFNKKGGGVFVTEFTADAISIWFWSRADIPENIVSGSPDSSTWGKPSATWPKDSCDIASYFDASSGDPTHGQVDYVSLDDAKSAGLISTSGTSAMMPYVLGLPETFNTKVDNTTTLSAGDKRKSIRIASTSAVTIGSLIICDIIPWPAWWTVGTDWPSNGEIDILEGVNLETTNQYTLHVKDSDCKQSSSVDITGNAVEANNDCNANNDGNAGCSYAEPASGSYGEDFNKKGGGVFVTEFTADAISIWFWSRADIPENIVSGSPDSSTWGKPSATWPKDSCDIASYFVARRSFSTRRCAETGPVKKG
ncbi:hypothetical protein JCM10213v2_004030 [Rhodosporidiobolus nylandii]